MTETTLLTNTDRVDRFEAFGIELGHVASQINELVKKYGVADPKKALDLMYEPMREDGQFRFVMSYDGF